MNVAPVEAPRDRVSTMKPDLQQIYWWDLGDKGLQQVTI